MAVDEVGFGLGDFQFDAAERIDDIFKMVVVDDDKTVDIDAEITFQGLHGQRWAAEAVGDIDTVGRVAGDLHPDLYAY